MSLELHTEDKLTVGERLVIDCPSGTLTGTSFAAVIGMPPISRLVYNLFDKKVILRTFRNGAVMRLLQLIYG